MISSIGTCRELSKPLLSITTKKLG